MYDNEIWKPSLVTQIIYKHKHKLIFYKLNKHKVNKKQKYLYTCWWSVGGSGGPTAVWLVAAVVRQQQGQTVVGRILHKTQTKINQTIKPQTQT